MHAARDALAPEIRHRGRGRTEEERRDLIGQAAVDLLGHAGIEAAQAGLDVRDGQAELGRGQRARQRGVRVTQDEHEVGTDVEHRLLQRGQHAARHVAVRSGPDAEMEIRSGDLELVEERARHLVVVVLAGVDEHLAQTAAQGARERCGLHELRAGAHHAEDRGPPLHASTGRES
jgi:hypothetical protein